MPTYDYVCSACNHRFEEFQSMSSDPLKKCPECKKNKLERLIGGGAGVIFKGSGFYQTDYKNTGSPAGSDGASGTDSSKGDQSKGDSGGAATSGTSDAKTGSGKKPND